MYRFLLEICFGGTILFSLWVLRIWGDWVPFSFVLDVWWWWQWPWVWLPVSQLVLFLLPAPPPLFLTIDLFRNFPLQSEWMNVILCAAPSVWLSTYWAWKVLSSPLKYARRECGQVSQPCRNSQAVWFMVDILTTCRSLLHNQWALIWFELFKPTTLLQQLNYSAVKHLCFY